MERRVKLPLPAPRVLPLTIAAMAALLALKSVALVRAAVPGGSTQAAAPAIAPAQAATPEHAAQAAPEPPPTPPPPPPSISDSERNLLLELRERRGDLDKREAALGAREAVLSSAEKRLTARVNELTALQVRLEALEKARHERDDANWAGLVKMYETMKPRDAATIFNDLDAPVLLQVLDRMKEAKAAPVLAAMQPDRARLITAQLAQLRSKANTIPPAAPSARAPAGG
jgi:flagellar motility protein MotE (MotC chaperone)